MRTYLGSRLVLTSGVLLALAGTASARGRRDLSDAPRHTAKVIRAAVGPGIGKNTQKLPPMFAGPAKKPGSKGASRVAKWLAQARQGDWKAFQSLLGSPSLGSTQAEDLVAATSVLQDPAQQGQVLEALVGKVPITTMLAAVDKIRWSYDYWDGDLAKEQVLRRLLLSVGQEKLSESDGAALAASASWPRPREARASLLQLLRGKISVAARLAAVRNTIKIRGGSWREDTEARFSVLLPLARENLSLPDAVAVAENADLLAWVPEWRAELLKTLRGKAPFATMLRAVEDIPVNGANWSGQSARREVLLSLARQENLSSSDAAVLARCSDLLGTAPNWQAELLENLFGRTQVSALRAGVDTIPTRTPAGREARYRMMLQLGQINSNGARSPN